MSWEISLPKSGQDFNLCMEHLVEVGVSTRASTLIEVHESIINYRRPGRSSKRRIEEVEDTEEYTRQAQNTATLADDVATVNEGTDVAKSAYQPRLYVEQQQLNAHKRIRVDDLLSTTVTRSLQDEASSIVTRSEGFSSDAEYDSDEGNASSVTTCEEGLRDSTNIDDAANSTTFDKQILMRAHPSQPRTNAGQDMVAEDAVDGPANAATSAHTAIPGQNHTTTRLGKY